MKIDRTFRLWAYSISHNYLVLRSPKVEADQLDCEESLSSNIDIEFITVQYIDISCLLSNIEMKELIEISDKYKKYKDFKVFEIKSDMGILLQVVIRLV